MAWLKRILILPPVVIGAALVWQAMARAPEPALVAPEERRVPVAYVTAEPRSFVPRIEGYGTVQPARVWTAVAEVAGTVEHVHPAFARGGFVRGGEVLVRVRAEDAELALDSADADLKSATARLEEMLVSKVTTASALSIEQKSLELAEAELARTRRLAKKGVVAESVVQTQQRDLLAQQSKVQSLESTLALLPAQIKAQEQSVAKSAVAKRAAELDVARTVVTAPFDARIASADVEIQQYVAAGATLGTLDGAASAEIDVQVSQDRMLAMARIASAYGSAGDAPSAQTVAAPVSCPAAADTPCGVGPASPGTLAARVWPTTDRGSAHWPADVVRVSDMVDPDTRSFGVILQVTEPYALADTPGRPPLIKGAFVHVTLAAPEAISAVLVPRSAIRNGRLMLVAGDDRLAFAPVRPIFTFGDIAVLAPAALPADARIITSALSPAIEGLLLAPERDIRTERRIADAATGSKP